MSYRIECIPNVSTADPAILDRIVAGVEATDGVILHFVDPGKSANRTVFTYLGPVDQVLKATETLFAIALSEIDMREHQGVHPRMGAVDVCPFVLLDDESYAKDLLRRVGEFARKISAKYDVAMYGYEHFALGPHVACEQCPVRRVLFKQSGVKGVGRLFGNRRHCRQGGCIRRGPSS